MVEWRDKSAESEIFRLEDKLFTFGLLFKAKLGRFYKVGLYQNPISFFFTVARGFFRA